MEQFFIKKDQNNPLWKEYLNWLNLKFNKTFVGKNGNFYGYDGINYCYSTESLIKVPIITLQEWYDSTLKEKNRFTDMEDLTLGDNFKNPQYPEEVIHEMLASNLARGNSYFKGVATYYTNKQIQTEYDKIRSFDDVYLVTRYYFPKITIKEVLEIILRIKPKTSIKNKHFVYPQLSQCPTINRIRVLLLAKEEVAIENIHNPFDSIKYNSRYSWQELLSLLDIKNKIDFFNYLVNVPKINMDDTSTYVSTQKDNPVVKQVIKKPKIISGLKIEYSHNKVTIGNSVFSITDLMGIQKKLSPIKFNSKEYEVDGFIIIDDKKIRKRQINNIIKFI